MSDSVQEVKLDVFLPIISRSVTPTRILYTADSLCTAQTSGLTPKNQTEIQALLMAQDPTMREEKLH